MAEIANAQSYPSKPVRFVIGFPAGGPNDILGRIVAKWLSDGLGQPFNVENKGGKSGNIATETVVRAPADGLHRPAVRPGQRDQRLAHPNLSFNFLRDITPVAGVTREPLVMVVHPSVAAKSVQEFIAIAKANPAANKMGVDRRGQLAPRHRRAVQADDGLQLPVVHYGGGGPALKAMIAGEAQMMFEPMSASIGPVRSGQLRALAVSTTQRSRALPEVPTIADTVAGYEASAVTGIGVPKGTPAEIVELLNKAVQAAFADAGMKARLADTGGNPLPGTSADFARLMAAETEEVGQGREERRDQGGVVGGGAAASSGTSLPLRTSC